ncbi:MAG: tetratricopeptide repeat protein [Pirellulales bacterium]|nr:tetratricopeptide repeat protein [Pirellulales bacterium]
MVAVLAGCRSLSLSEPPVDDIAVQRRQRQATAIEEYERKRTYAEFESSRASWDRGDLRNSQATLERLLRRAPKHRDARLLLARVHFEQDRPQEALAQLQTALVNSPDDPEVHRALGFLLEDMDKPEEAWAHFDLAAKLADQSDMSLSSDSDLADIATASLSDCTDNMLGPAKRVTGLSESGEPPALFWAETEDQEDTATWPQRGATLVTHSVGTDINDGNSTMHQNTAILIQQGEKALAKGDFDRALAGFRQAAFLERNNPQIPTAAAIAALREGCPEVAATVAQEALVAFPHWIPLLRTLGTAYYRQGDYESSQLVLHQALSLDKSDALSYFLLGCTQLKLKRFEAARACFADAQRLDPSFAVH